MFSSGCYNVFFLDSITQLYIHQDVTSQGGDRKQKRNKGITLLHGVYMNTSRVVVKVEYLPERESIVHIIKFSTRCEQEKALALVRSVLQDWEDLYCIH